MKTLERHLGDYLELRRGLGFDLGRVESRLRGFLSFMKANPCSLNLSAFARTLLFAFEILAAHPVFLLVPYIKL